jgi:hypothetical protein
MQYTFLGKTGMKVSRLCLGTMNFARQTSEQNCFRMMDEALDMGINFFDTADAYGKVRGGAESIIGRWLDQGGGRRDAVIIAAKVFGHCAPFYDRYEENSATATGCQDIRSSSIAKAPSNACRPTISKSSKCTTSTTIAAIMKCGRRWMSCKNRERSFTWALATTLDGTSPNAA